MRFPGAADARQRAAHERIIGQMARFMVFQKAKNPASVVLIGSFVAGNKKFRNDAAVCKIVLLDSLHTDDASKLKQF